jgi:serine phosphatase RsbU (regulator of sigma subunit)
VHADGVFECLECSGFPLAIMEDAEYEEDRIEVQEGDRLLFFSDGALEITPSSVLMCGVACCWLLTRVLFQ